MPYKQEQKKLQVSKLQSQAGCFGFDNGYGDFEKFLKLPFVLKDGKNNLAKIIADDVIRYFHENNIDWWGENKKYPTGHLLSSQIQCLNFLFPLKNDKESVLELARLFDDKIDNVFPVFGDLNNEYIAFEFVCDNEKLLGENDFGAKRGAYCTSVDAFIFAIKDDKKILIPIEWKYTEIYPEHENKALENKKGDTRQARYNHLIKKSDQLKDFGDLANSPYYFEPLYEFMRQTILMEQMIVNRIADDFLHIIAVSSENKELLGNNYPFSSNNLETIWVNCLKHPEKCKFIDTKLIFKIFENKAKYSQTAEYLRMRYY